MSTNKTTAFVAIAAVLIVGSFLTGVKASTPQQESGVAGTTSSPTPTAIQFDTLASSLNSQAEWLGAIVGDNGNVQPASDTPHCGNSGECNWVTCPASSCPDGYTEQCSCTASGDTCGFFTKYPVYNCDCKCQQTPVNPTPPPPDPCTVSVAGKCIILGKVQKPSGPSGLT